MRLGCTVELALGVIPAADHRQDRAVRRHRDQRRLSDMPLRPLPAQPVLDDLLGGVLEPWIESRCDREIERRIADQPLDLDFGRVEEIIVVGFGLRRHREFRRMISRRRRLGFIERACLDHRLQHKIHSPCRGFRITARRQVGGRADQSGQHRRLGDIEIGGFLPEIAVSRRVDTKCAGAEIGRVQVVRQDLVLAEARLQPKGQHDLLHLAAQRALGREIGESRQLLRDRAAAFGAAAAGQIAPGGAHHAARVDAAMLEKPSVLDRDDRVHKVFGQVVGRQFLAAINAAGRKRRALTCRVDDCSGRLLPDRARQRQGIRAVADKNDRGKDREPPGQCQPEHRTPEGFVDRHLAPFPLRARWRAGNANCDAAGIVPRFIERKSAVICSPAGRPMRRRVEQPTRSARSPASCAEVDRGAASELGGFAGDRCCGVALGLLTRGPSHCGRPRPASAHAGNSGCGRHRAPLRQFHRAAHPASRRGKARAAP